MTNKILLLLSLFLIDIFAYDLKIQQRYAESKNCAGCHKEQTRDWKTTWHSKSHITQNILYKKSLEFMSKKLFIDSQKLSIECAKCHNPRVSVKKVDKAFILSKAFGAKNDKVKKIDHALNTSYLKEGISCIVCHNIDKIEHTDSLSKRGFDAVVWGKNSTMVGPFDSNRTTFHKSVKRDHFTKNVNRLCFVCHFGGENRYKLPVYTTGKEYLSFKDSNKKCVDCHMSVEKKGVIAANIKPDGQVIKKRELRSHLFASVRNSDIAKEAFDFKVEDNGSYILIILKNKTPHFVPTGYGGRSLKIEVSYFDHKKKIESIYRDLNVRYIDEEKNITIPHLAKSVEKDLRLKPNESRKIPFIIPKGTTDVKVTIWYQLVNDDIKKLLDIDDDIFSKLYKIKERDLKIKAKEK